MWEWLSDNKTSNIWDTVDPKASLSGSFYTFLKEPPPGGGGGESNYEFIHIVSGSRFVTKPDLSCKGVSVVIFHT